MKVLSASRAVAAGNRLGEGIVWCEREQSLYWTDIEAATLWRHHPATGTTDHWSMPERLACFALCQQDDWLLLGLASRLAFLHLPTGRLEVICAVEPHLATRLNDGACDREGRFVFGTKHEPAAGQSLQTAASFYRLDADLSLHRLDLPRVAIANGIAFSPDGRTMYFCDSPATTLCRCEYGSDGRVEAPREWVDLRSAAGNPDGACVDADGGLWVALWGAGRVVQYDRAGHAVLTVKVPTRYPSRPTLGGTNLDILYITSARDGMTARELADDPEAGNVFSVEVVQPGLPEPCFAGTPPRARFP